MAISMYRLVGASFLYNNKESEIGFALFSKQGANMQFIAETDNYFKILRFVPFIDTDGFAFYPIENGELYIIGQPVPIPSRTAAFGFRTEEANFYIERVDELLLEVDPIFKLSLAAVVGLNFEDVIPILKSASTTSFTDRAAQELWLQIEMESRPASEIYWTSLDHTPALEFQAELDAIDVHDTRDALRWLRIERNFRSVLWTKVWLYARSLLPFSKELRDISAVWLNVIFSDFTAGEALQDVGYLSVLTFVCELSTTIDEFDELYDVVEELHMERPDVMQLLVNSKVSYRNIASSFIDHGNLKAVESADYWARLKGFPKSNSSS